jgi:hypothetical protein
METRASVTLWQQMHAERRCFDGEEYHQAACTNRFVEQGSCAAGPRKRSTSCCDGKHGMLEKESSSRSPLGTIERPLW